MKYSIIPARMSETCLLPPKFIVVDIYKIGTHEQANNLHQDQMLDVLQSLIQSCYKGPAMSVLERESDSIYNATAENTFEKRDIDDYGRIGIADGHNRLASLKLLDCLGLLRERFIPVQIIPGRKPNLVFIKTLNETDIPWTIEEIENCFTDENKTLELTNTSHFEVAFSDNISRRVRDGQPDIVISKENFINLDRLRVLKNELATNNISVDTKNCLNKYSIDLNFLKRIVQL